MVMAYFSRSISAISRGFTRAVADFRKLAKDDPKGVLLFSSIYAVPVVGQALFFGYVAKEQSKLNPVVKPNDTKSNSAAANAVDNERYNSINEWESRINLITPIIITVGATAKLATAIINDKTPSTSIVKLESEGPINVILNVVETLASQPEEGTADRTGNLSGQESALVVKSLDIITGRCKPESITTETNPKSTISAIGKFIQTKYFDGKTPEDIDCSISIGISSSS